VKRSRITEGKEKRHLWFLSPFTVTDTFDDAVKRERNDTYWLLIKITGFHSETPIKQSPVDRQPK
jgi:hypothetical protein